MRPLWIDGTAFYEYHRSFSARVAMLIQQQNIKVDWGTETMVCFAHCGSITHLSSFCPLLANPKTPNHQFPRGNVTGKQTFRVGPGLV